MIKQDRIEQYLKNKIGNVERYIAVKDLDKIGFFSTLRRLLNITARMRQILSYGITTVKLSRNILTFYLLIRPI